MITYAPEQWRATFDALPIFGDGMNSVRAGNRAIFLTGDAVPRDGGPWAHSSLTVVDLTTLAGHVVRGNAEPSAGSPYQMIPDDEGTRDGKPGYHWLGPAFVADGIMYSLAPHNVVDPDNGFGFTTLGTDWAIFDVRAEPQFVGLAPVPGMIDDPVVWGAGVWYDRATRWVYVAGVSRASTDGWTGHDVYLARVRVSDIADPHAWVYLSSWHWSEDVTQARPILTSAADGGVETSFTFWKDVFGWHIASRLGGAWGHGDAPEVDVWSTRTPIAAGDGLKPSWRRVTAATLPIGEPNAYLAMLHPDLPLTPAGNTLVTYNQAGRETTWLDSRGPVDTGRTL